jgi:hypothetical protein
MLNSTRRNRLHASGHDRGVSCGVFVEIEAGRVVSLQGHEDNSSGSKLSETQRV